MPNCEICDQELVEGDFEEKIGICVNCIMIESRAMSSKLIIITFLFFLGGLMFIVTFLQIIFIVPLLFVDFEQYIFYLIPPLIACVISGSGVIYISFFLKFR
jgi:hypothetical protein